MSAQIIDSGDNFGGIWNVNRYPGVRVDTKAPYYQLALPKVWPKFKFTEKYSAGEEIREYFAQLDQAYDFRKDTIFNHRIVEARYDPSSEKWQFLSDKGLKASSRFAIFATGTTNQAYKPDFPGLDRFRGRLIHPAAWPTDLDVRGKRVGLIGQGSSGVQILQEVAKKDCSLVVFIRTPCIALPMGQRSISPSEYTEQDYESLLGKTKLHENLGSPYTPCPVSFHEESAQQRQERFRLLWSEGGLGISANNYYDVIMDEEANSAMYDFWSQRVRARVQDPTKREIVAPHRQFQWFGAKRACLETDYYEMIDRKNVHLVDLEKTQIKEFTQNGIVTVRESREEVEELDVVILATGYDSVTGSLYDMDVRDIRGRTLREKWQGGIRTHLGLMVPGMPNAFFLYGPQAPTSLANAPQFVELEMEWVINIIDKMEREHVKEIDASEAAASIWSEKVWRVFRKLLHGETASWWTGGNIPGKRREPLIWFGGVKAWHDECTKSLKDWSDFVIRKR